MSTAYYALFHQLAHTCADRLAGTRARRDEAWRHVYRTLAHARIRNTPREQTAKLAPDARAFLALAKKMQGFRNEADYDPWVRLYKSEVLSQIVAVRTAMWQFERLSATEQRTLAILLLMKTHG